MHNLESTLENEMHKILLEGEIQTHHIVLAIIPDLLSIKERKGKKENLSNRGICHSNGRKVKTKKKKKQTNEEIDKNLDFARELKKYRTL